MADLFKNITESDYGDKGVRLLPSRVTGDAATIQRIFDELSLDVLIPAVNVVVNTLNSLKLDFRVTSNDIKAIRINSDNVIEVSLNGVSYIAVSDPKGSTEELKTYITNYVNQINETLVKTKADKNNVLEKDNTTAYTPTSNYHPTTKKYVDDINTNLTNIKADKSNVLEKDNTEEFIPTLDYHPATKKYVDQNSTADMTKAVYDPTGRNTDIFKYVDDAVFNTGAADMTKAVYDPTGRNTDMFGYVDNKATEILAYVDNKIGDINTALDNVNGEVI